LPEGLSDEPLRAGEPAPLGVRRVAEQQVDATVAELGQLADVGAEAVDGRVVELPVARVQHAAGVGLEHDGDVVRHRVRHADEVDPERPELDRPALGLDLAQVRRAQQTVLVELRLVEPEREPRRPDLGHLDLAQEVRKHEIDAEVLVAREREPGVDDDAPVLVLEHRHVLADLAQSAERDHAKEWTWHPKSVTARAPASLLAGAAQGTRRKSPLMVTTRSSDWLKTSP